MTNAGTARRLPVSDRTLALAATLSLAAAAWAGTAWQLNGMDMGVATRLGSFTFFAGMWACMMTAMMLPGAAAAVASRAQAGGLAGAAAFVGCYLAAWAVAGVAVYLLDRPHGTMAAGAVTIAAGLYELTPLKREFRQRCQRAARSGLAFGLCCAASSLGLMAMLVAVGVMSLAWMALITVIVAAQKLLPASRAVDLPLGAAITGVGIWILVSPASVPGLIPPM
jgi:predicted metal-binding membrane protein